MNEKLQYAEMLEIPVSTCNVNFRPSKRKKFSLKKKESEEDLKALVMKKVNEEDQQIEDSKPQEQSFAIDDEGNENLAFEELNQNEYDIQDEGEEKTITIKKMQKPNKPKRGKLKFSVIGVQLLVVGVLIATIFLTNAFVSNSGINVFMRNIFGTTETVEVDNKVYTDFAPALPVDNFSAITVEDGIMTIAGEESVYSPCNGTVTAISQDENGKYSLEITHNQNFKTTFSGLDYAYCIEGDNVFSTIPVGYINGDNAKMCFFSTDNTLITDYALENETLVWKSLT